MPWHEPWQSKIRRHIRKHFIRIFPKHNYYVTQYLGASFLLAPQGIGALEVSAKIWERLELFHLMRRCAELRPDIFIDVGANIGVYSCVVLRNGSAPRALLFEPDHTNLIHLRSNLLINGLLDRAQVNEFALGETNARLPLFPGAIAKGEYRDADGGFSMIVENDAAGEDSYLVNVARFDDKFELTGSTLAIKLDIEHYECRALAGMERTLRHNRCIVQVESYIMRDQVIGMMKGFGYEMTADFMPNYVFENAVEFA